MVASKVNVGKFLILAILGFWMSAGSALAQSPDVAVKSGAKTRLFTTVLISPRCRTYSNVIRIRQKPKHGEVFVEKHQHTVRDTTGRYARCFGQTFSGRLVSYKSKPGYKGKDNFTFSREENGRQFTTKVNVTVK